LSFGRHLEIPVVISNRFDEERIIGISWNESRSGITSLEQSGRSVQGKTAFLLFAGRIVTILAALDENRTDVSFEERQLVGGDFL